MRARPVHEPYNGDGYYALILAAIDDETLEVHSVRNGLHKFFRGRGVGPVLYPDVAKRLAKRLRSSDGVVRPRPGTGAARAAAIWEYLAAIGKATRASDSFEIDCRPTSPAAVELDRIKGPARPSPKNEAEFRALMEEVDSYLESNDVPIVARSMRGLGEVARRLRTELYPGIEAGDPLPNVYEGLDLAIRIGRWFDARYGEKQKIDFSPGTVVLQLRGDLWPMKLPLLIGRHVAFASRTEKSDPVEGNVDVGPPSRFNVLDSIEDMSEDMKHALSDEELQLCDDMFHTAMGAYNGIKDCRDLRFIKEAEADHRAAVEHLNNRRPHPGQSRWSSLQAAEKMYKTYLQAMGAAIPRGRTGHDLALLSIEAAKVGLEPADAFFIDAVNCSPDVRYGDVPSTVPEAIAAHHAALELTWYVANEIRRVKDLPRRAL